MGWRWETDYPGDQFGVCLQLASESDWTATRPKRIKRARNILVNISKEQRKRTEEGNVKEGSMKRTGERKAWLKITEALKARQNDSRRLANFL